MESITNAARLPEAAYHLLADDLRICRVLNGMWQVSGAHGSIDPARALEAMFRYHNSGFTTWDLADHYGPAEDFIGTFRTRLVQRYGLEALRHTQALTKWVPSPGPMPRAVVERAVEIARRRMDTARLDLLQFHWWEYRDSRYLDALEQLAILRDAGKIHHLGLTNFDTVRLRHITEQGIPIISNQVQYSLIDRRPEQAMIPFCQEAGIGLLTYGTLCGGLLSDKYLNAPEPGPGRLTTASLRKYKQMINAWGGWALFQELLSALRVVADRHGVDIAAVAVRYILDQPAVAGVIAGARLGLTEHHADNTRAFSFALDDDDRDRIDTVTAQGENLLARIGDCGDEYRR